MTTLEAENIIVKKIRFKYPLLRFPFVNVSIIKKIIAPIVQSTNSINKVLNISLGDLFSGRNFCTPSDIPKSVNIPIKVIRAIK
jgi:hypothetical protein